MTPNTSSEALQLPACNILSYVFSAPGNERLTNARRLLIRRLAAGFDRQDRMGLPKQATIMLVAPTSSPDLPIIYLAAVGSGRIFAFANPDSTVDQLAHHIRATQPSLILADPWTALPNVMEAVAQTEVNRDIVFAIEAESDWSDPKNDIYDWRIIMARPTEGRGWSWDSMSESTARQTVAVVSVSTGEQARSMSHYDVVARALEMTKNEAGRDRLDPWLAVLPWNQMRTNKANYQKSKL